MAVIITRGSEALPLLRWAVRCALARDANVIAIRPVVTKRAQQPGGTIELPLLGELPTSDPLDRAVIEAAHEVIREQLSPDGRVYSTMTAEERAVIGCPIITCRRVEHHDIAEALCTEVKRSGAMLLLAHGHPGEGTSGGGSEGGSEGTSEGISGGGGDATGPSLIKHLFLHCPCDVLLLRPGAWPGTCRRVLVPTSGGPNAAVALRLAQGMVRPWNGHVHALYVEPKVGPYASMVGQSIVDKIVRRSLGHDTQHVEGKVEIANDFREGVARAAEQGYDLVLLGAANPWMMRRMLFGVVPEKLLYQPDESGVTVGVLRRSIPVASRLTQAVRRVVERTVPQLDREGRLSLVERVQGSSQWDFDFIALVGLSTSIAALGLIINSASVVIGAMLVAPLMTPLVGCGLALVQGNLVLIRHAARSVLFGFCLAFGIAVLLGFLIPGVEVVPEMLARTKPNVLDLGVAFVSGIAAAYASSRPNLFSALPGVAIAAALVPPIATAGMTLALGFPVLSAGAALLFLTNIVAIVLGSAISLYLVGFRAGHAHGRDKPWVRRGVVALIIATALLAVPLSYVLHHRVTRTPRELIARIEQRLSEWSGATIEQVERLSQDGGAEVRLTITAPEVAPAWLADELAAIASERLGEPVRLRIVTHLMTDGAASGSLRK